MLTPLLCRPRHLVGEQTACLWVEPIADDLQWCRIRVCLGTVGIWKVVPSGLHG